MKYCFVVGSLILLILSTCTLIFGQQVSPVGFNPNGISLPIQGRQSSNNYQQALIDTVVLLEQLTERWDSASVSWVNSNWNIFHYDTQGKLTDVLAKYWLAFGSTWMDVAKLYYSYDSLERLTGWIQLMWDFLGSNWTNNQKDTILYDSLGHQGEMIAMQWAGGWVNSFKYIWTYDTDGLAIEQRSKYWNDTGWVDQQISTFTYDLGNHGPTWQYTQTWNDTLKTWHDDSKTLTMFDGNGNPITSLTQAFRGGSWVNDMMMTIDYDSNGRATHFAYSRWDGRGWFPLTRGTYTYQHLVTNASVSDIDLPRRNTLFANYPNPFNPSTEVRWQNAEVSHISLRVYDELGREIATLVDEIRQPGEHSITWNANGIPSGVYFYRLMISDPIRGSGRVFSETKKMVLIR